MNSVWFDQPKRSISAKMVEDAPEQGDWNYTEVATLLQAIQEKYGRLTHSPLSWDTSRNELERIMHDCDQAIARGDRANPTSVTTRQMRDLACYLEGKYPDADYLRVSPELADLIAELSQLDQIAQACIVIDCIEHQMQLHPNWLKLNYSPLFCQSSDRLIQIFEEILPSLNRHQRQQIVEALLPNMWDNIRTGQRSVL